MSGDSPTTNVFPNLQEEMLSNRIIDNAPGVSELAVIFSNDHSTGNTGGQMKWFGLIRIPAFSSSAPAVAVGLFNPFVVWDPLFICGKWFTPADVIIPIVCKSGAIDGLRSVVSY